MSFTKSLVLWLHVGFAIFSIGPLTVATMSTPRYLRARNLPVLRYLARTTTIFTVVSLGVLIVGIVLAQLKGDFAKPWLSISMTLFVVALVLLLLVIRDQRRAIAALGAATQPPGAGTGRAERDTSGVTGEGGDAGEEPGHAAPATADTAHLASVERGRIAMLAGLASIIWLVILALMVWQP